MILLSPHEQQDVDHLVSFMGWSKKKTLCGCCGSLNTNTLKMKSTRSEECPNAQAHIKGEKSYRSEENT
jgi:hypothetical protein